LVVFRLFAAFLGVCGVHPLGICSQICPSSWLPAAFLPTPHIVSEPGVPTVTRRPSDVSPIARRLPSGALKVHCPTCLKKNGMAAATHSSRRSRAQSGCIGRALLPLSPP